MRRTLAATITAAAACLSLAACNPAPTGASKASATAGSPTRDDAAEGSTATLPNLVGKGLQSAQDAAQAAGFYGLDSHDALGRGRMQILDRDWKVCTQKPSPGNAATSVTVDLGAVKLSEDCPGADRGAAEQPKATDTMPDLRGKSVKVARQALESGASITVKDVTGQDRFVVMESNWKVCTQNPVAGAKYSGQPVTFGATKFDEDCS
ncbi:PASTA domain-containing protein [Streptomyces lydicus]|uniref:PASTA domain-containing protein n=1 Tax=Streptomyces lydicus TaxID=47763 RepID=UPI0036FC25C4